MNITKRLKSCLVLATVFASANILATQGPCRDDQNHNPTITPIETPGEAFYIFPPAADSDRRSVHLYSDHPPESLFRLVTNYEAFAEFIPRVAISQVVHRDTQAVEVYQRLRFPAPMRDRHYLIRSEWTANREAQHFVVDWWLVNGTLPAPPDAAVRPGRFDGCWDIRRLPGGGTDAVYSITVVPGGLIPEWLARKGVDRYLDELMKALQAKLASNPTAQPARER